MVRNSLMNELNLEYRELLNNKPVNTGKFDFTYLKRLNKWETKQYELHNQICDLAIEMCYTKR